MHIYIINQNLEIKQKKMLYAMDIRSFEDDMNCMFGENRWFKNIIDAREELERINKDHEKNNR